MGRESVVKLKELFIDRKIPREERRKNPIIAAPNGEILWAPGLPPSKDYLLTEIATRALQLTYEK
jgi:tRNA(Ile)-lysidine synthase